MVLGISFFLLFVSLIGSAIVMWLYRVFGGPDGKNIDWSGDVKYPSYFALFTIMILIGYHIGIYSYILLSSPDIRFPAAGWAVFSVCAACAWLTILWNRRSALVYASVIAIAISGYMMAIRANGFVQALNIADQIASVIILLLILIRKQAVWTLSTMVRALAAAVPHSIIHVVRIARSLFRRDAEKKQHLGGWIKTIAITAGVLVIFIYILSQADPVFSQIIKEFRTQLFGRTATTIIILFILAAFSSIRLSGTKQTSGGFISFRDILGTVIAVVAILFVFLFVQYKYLFLGSRDLLVTLHLSFSEYVRKGFTELLLATFIGGFLSYITILKVRSHTDSRQMRWATAINIVLIVELFFLLLSALKRDLLYVDTYGLTRVRVVGGLFLLWLFSFLVLLALFNLKRNLRESRILASVWIILLLVWIALNMLNIDAIVVAGAPKHHQYTDYFYLMQLSEDSMEGKVALLPSLKTETEALLAKETLTDVEKSQLAGIKLALITFIEKRDRLYRYYAPESWLLQNGWRIGNQFMVPGQYDMLRVDSYQASSSRTPDNVNESIYATDWKYRLNKRGFDPEFLKLRKWAFYNQSEAHAFNILTANSEAYFEPVNDLLRRIRVYQVKNQVYLFKEENRLLHEFSYPFLTVNLRRYYPDQLYRISVNNTANSSLGFRIFSELEQNQEWPISKLQQVSCSQPLPSTMKVYGVLSNYSSASIEPVQKAQMESITAIGKGAIPVMIPFGKKVERVTLENETREYNGPMTKPYTKPTAVAYYSPSDQVPVRAVLRPVITGSGPLCNVSFEAEKITEIMGL